MAAPKTAAAVASRGAFQVARMGQKVGRCSLRNGRPKRQQIAAATTFRRQSLAAQTYHEAPRRGMQRHAKVGKVQAFCKTRSRSACVGEPALPVIFLFVVESGKYCRMRGVTSAAMARNRRGLLFFATFPRTIVRNPMPAIRRATAQRASGSASRRTCRVCHWA